VAQRRADFSGRELPGSLMRIDINAFVGAYPFARIPATSPDGLLAAMDRTAIDTAWITHLPGMFWRDPTEGNAWLYGVCRSHNRLRPVPALHPGLAHWQDALNEAVDQGAPALRADPGFLGIDPAGAEMRVLAAACGAAEVPLMLAVRLEDSRQRHPRDVTPELSAAAVRSLIRCDEDVRLFITHADRAFVEEVHFGSTPAEAERILWDISWLWGPPEDHLAALVTTVGVERFVFGTGQPLRLPENAVAKLDLLDLPADARERIESGNAQGPRGA
jgi:hypothetical protein